MSEFVWTDHPRRINVGCGWDKREGYLNVDLHDFHEPDLVADVRKLDMLPSGEYDEVIAQDVLEHLERSDAPIALAEWARVLRIGGTLFVRVPDLIGLFEMMNESEDPAEQTKVVHLLFGTQAYTGDFHLNGFTEPLLRAALHDAGFDIVSFTGMHGWLFDVVAERVEHPAPIDPAQYVRPNRRVVAAAPAPVEAPAPVATAAPVAPVAAPIALHTGEDLSQSRLPGGRMVHRGISRLLSRHFNLMNAQFEQYQRTVANGHTDPPA